MSVWFPRGYRLALFVSVPLLLVMLALPLSALAETTTVVTPFAEMTNPCNEDQVVGDGRYKLTIISNVSESGSIRIAFQSEQSFKGVGVPSGSEYVGSATATQSETGNASGTFEITHTDSVLILSKGIAPSYYQHVTTHVTVTNGVPTADMAQFRTECK